MPVHAPPPARPLGCQRGGRAAVAGVVPGEARPPVVATGGRPILPAHLQARPPQAGSGRRLAGGGRATSAQARRWRPAIPRSPGPRGSTGEPGRAGTAPLRRPRWRDREKSGLSRWEGRRRPPPTVPLRCRGPWRGSLAGRPLGPGGRRPRRPSWAGLGCHRPPRGPGRGRAARSGSRPPVPGSRRAYRRPAGLGRRRSRPQPGASRPAALRGAVPKARWRRRLPRARTPP